jgi:uncharacterized damage-inducible protein DinB
MENLHKPVASEYPVYYERYLKLLPDETDIIALLKNQVEDIIGLVHNLRDHEAGQGYAVGKWSIKELLQHMLDTERIFAYRALCFSRGEEVSLPSYNEDQYAENSVANRRRLADIILEYRLLRQSTLNLIKSFSPEMIDLMGSSGGNAASVRSIIWIIAAHEKHHLNIIKERYLPFFEINKIDF